MSATILLLLNVLGVAEQLSVVGLMSAHFYGLIVPFSYLHRAPRSCKVLHFSSAPFHGPAFSAPFVDNVLRRSSFCSLYRLFIHADNSRVSKATSGDCDFVIPCVCMGVDFYSTLEGPLIEAPKAPRSNAEGVRIEAP